MRRFKAALTDVVDAGGEMETIDDMLKRVANTPELQAKFIDLAVETNYPLLFCSIGEGLLLPEMKERALEAEFKILLACDHNNARASGLGVGVYFPGVFRELIAKPEFKPEWRKAAVELATKMGDEEALKILSRHEDIRAASGAEPRGKTAAADLKS